MEGETKDRMGMKATLRNVFIPTPDPTKAPSHPCDRASSLTSATSSITNGIRGKDGEKDKMVDYINTLEITTPETMDSKEGVVVSHGYAAAIG